MGCNKEQKEERLGQERVMKCGLKCKIIEYIKYDNITVEFENGVIIKNKKYSNFKDGEINDGNRIFGTPHKILTGMKFDKLLIGELAEKRKTSDGSNEYFYNCKCDCGNDCIRSVQAIKSKSSINSCGKCIKNIEDSVFYKANEVVKYFKNIEDSYKYTVGSNAIVDTVCDVCGNEKKFTVKSITSRGFRCQVCSDGISYPEKFMAEALRQSNIIFEREKIFNWATDKRYDFYIPSLSCIVETHGIQHYVKRKTQFKRTFEEERENDAIKRKIALENGIEHYIVLDCSKSEIEHIKKSIIESELSNIINIKKIDFVLCGKKANKGITKDVCVFWENSEDKTIENVRSVFGLNAGTIRSYLKKGTELGWCNYFPKLTRELYLNKKNLGKHKKRKVRCIEIDLKFNSITECSKYMENLTGDIFTLDSIQLNCKNKRKQYKGYHFEYIED